jgi:transposase
VIGKILVDKFDISWSPGPNKNYQEVEEMSKKIFIVSLSDKDRQQLHTYVNTGIHSARSIKRARILLLADQGLSDPAIASQVSSCKATVFNIRRRYCLEGLQAALHEKPRSGKPRTITGRKVAHVIALACSKPPAGRQRWTLRLLADKVVELELLDTCSPSTVWTLLKKTNLNPGKSSNGVSARSPVGF